MQSALVLGVAITMGTAGCASSGAGFERGEPDFSGAIRRSQSSVKIGEAHVVDGRVNPQMPVLMSSRGSEIAVGFGRPGHVAAVATLDGSSLQPLSLLQHPSVDAATAPETHAVRVELESGRFVLCWTRGSLDWGHRALAQAFDRDGSPRGAPVAISAPDADVMGQLRAITPDGQRVIATFVAISRNAFELIAVPIEIPGPTPAATASR